MNNPTSNQMYAAISSIVRATGHTPAAPEAKECTCVYFRNERTATGCLVHDAGALIRSIMAKLAIVSSVDFV